MLRNAINCGLLAATLCIFCLPAYGWDETGHKITAYIAWQRMTPDVRERVIKLLREAPEDAQLSTFYMTFGAQTEAARKLDLFMIASTWPDIVRDRDFKVRYGKYHKGNWHYDDKFWKVVDGKIEYLPPPEDGGVALAKMSEFSELIRGNAPDAQKAIAIAWLVHVIGDLHQPLHTSARVTESEPKGDRGGNTFLLSPPGKGQQNLHSFWDGIIGRTTANSEDACDLTYMEPIARKIMKKHPLEKMGDRLKPGKFEEWTAESLTLAQTEVFSPDLIRGQKPSEKYKKKALKIAEERLALAGYRIAALFIQAFQQPTVAEAPCRVIRKIMYPVFKKQTPENQAKAKPTPLLLDICPAGPAARPTIMIAVNGKGEARTFDVVKAFESDDEARSYAAANSITDVSFTDQ